jgi:TonB family protein
VPAEYAGAALTVQDVAPFSRSCAGDGGCILQLGSVAGDAAAGPSAQLAPSAGHGPPAKTVALDQLHRLTGEPVIRPSDDAVPAAGKPLGVAIVKVCLGVDGKVESTRLVKSSGGLAYDAQLQATIQATWTFQPVAIDGQRGSVCTQVTFLPSGS